MSCKRSSFLLPCGGYLIASINFLPALNDKVGDFVTSVCEWVDSHRLFLTARDQDSWNACSLIPQIGAVSEP